MSSSVRRRAKYILVHLDDGAVLIAHLGMSGRMIILPERPESFGKHDHAVFETDVGTVITFNDARRFGLMDLTTAEALGDHPMLRALGPEPLGNGFSGPVLAERLAGKMTPIKAALLDQSVVAGLGNIYVSEALFQARLSPTRIASTVSGAKADRLAAAIREVLGRAIEAGGSSLRDYRQASGSWAISSTSSPSTTARAPPAPDAAATWPRPGGCGGSCRPGARLSIVRRANADIPGGMTAFPANVRAALAALLLAGPAVAGLGSLAFPSIPADAAEAQPFVPGLPDVPAMPGLRAAEAEPLVFDKPGGRIVQAVLSGAVPRNAVLAFYDQTLPQLGWRRTTERVFVREGEELRLEFAPAKPGPSKSGAKPADGTTIRFTLNPR